jgi:hypothetical protein
MQKLVKNWAGAAEDRLAPDHAGQLSKALTDMAATSDGWWTAALVPVPARCGAGKAALTMTISTANPDTTSRAIREVIPLLTHDYPLRAFRLAGLDLSSPSQEGDDQRGSVAFRSPPAGTATTKGPAPTATSPTTTTTDRFWGKRPTLSWLAGRGELNLLLASEEIGRNDSPGCVSPLLPAEGARSPSALEEAAAGHPRATTYFLARPTVLLRWLSSRSQTAPLDETSPSEGAIAGATGPVGAGPGWRLVVHIDSQQIRPLASFLLERRQQR